MKRKKQSLNVYVQSLFSILFLLGFLFLCTAVYFNRFQFNQPSDSRQYALPFFIMFTAWIFMCLTDVYALFVRTETAQHFFTRHIPFLLFLGGNYLWSKGAELFLLNHLIIFFLGVGSSYLCIQQLRIHLEHTDPFYDIQISQDREHSS